jgi:lipopolysaccharide/colanic/teichoic acid biosynthesis glycosyltransferase
MALKMFPNWLSKSRSNTFGAPTDFLHSENGFRSILEVESMRADRSSMSFCLAVFRWPGTKRDDVDLSGFVKHLKSRMRTTDYAGQLDGGGIGVILWDTNEPGAQSFVQKLDLNHFATKVRQCELFVYPRERAKETQDESGDDQFTDEQQLLETVREANEELVELLRPDSSGEAGEPDVAKFERGSDAQWPAGSGAPSRASSQAETLSRGDSAPVVLLDEPRQLQPATDSVVEQVAQVQQRPALDRSLVPTVKPLEELFVRPLPLWKRAIDITGALVGLTVFLPLLVAVAAMIKLTSPGPVFFVQRRSGRGNKPFSMYKFRSMVTGAEAQKQDLMTLNEQDGPAFKIENDPRITAVGRLIRATSLDELPQLFNVLKGDMSLVGPRPLPCDESDACANWQRRRLNVTPGLTCIWQVKDRRTKIPFADWMRMDLRYIASRTFLHDVRLILKTIVTVVGRRGH